MTKEQKEKPLLEWNTYADKADIEDYLENYNEQLPENEHIGFDKAQELLDSDADYWQVRWDDFADRLTEEMKKQIYWRDDASNLGWLHRSGYKVFKAEDGKQLLEQISPKAECSYEVYKHRDGFEIKISHHDAPTGETHLVKPLTDREFYELTTNDTLAE